MPRPALDGNKLIHDAAAGADKLVLRSLAKLGQLDAVEATAHKVEKSAGAGHFKGSRRAQPGTDRDFAMNERVGSLELVSGFFQNHGNPDRIITPRLGGTHRVVRQVYLAGLVKIIGAKDEACIRPWANRQPTIEINRRGQHEAVVVVGVLANQIDASGGAIKATFASKMRSKSLCQVICLSHFSFQSGRLYWSRERKAGARVDPIDRVNWPLARAHFECQAASRACLRGTSRDRIRAAPRPRSS